MVAKKDIVVLGTDDGRGQILNVIIYLLKIFLL